MNSRPISKNELASQGRFKTDGSSGEYFSSSFFGGGGSPAHSYTKAPSSGGGMGTSPIYHRHMVTPNMVEYDEVGYGYDERYSSPILEFPEMVYDYLIHPVASGTYYTGQALLHGTGAVVGAGYHGASFVVGMPMRMVGKGVSGAASGVAHGISGAYNTVEGEAEYLAGYSRGGVIHSTGAGITRVPLTSTTVASPAGSPFATSARLSPAAVPVSQPTVTEIDKVDASGRLVERDFIIQGTAPVVAPTAPMVAVAAPAPHYVTPAKVLN